MSSITTSTSGRILSAQIERVIEQLKSQCVRESTIQNYLAIWRQFNQFLVKLDKKPKDWED